jgi:hypothetical protein
VRETGIALLTAVRAAVVVPSAFAIGEVALANPNTGLFAAFGSLGMLIFVDFSGACLAAEPPLQTRASRHWHRVFTVLGDHAREFHP